MSHRARAALLGAATAAGGALSLAVAPAASLAADPAPTVLEERFSGAALPAGWRAVEGRWSVVDGRLVGVSANSGQQSRITFGPHLENFRIDAKVRFESVADPARWTAIGLDMPADGGVPWWHAAMRSNTTAANGTEFAERTAANAWNVTDAAPAPAAAGTGREVNVAIEVRGSRARWLFEGREVLSTRSLRRSADGALGLVVNGSTVSFDDVVVRPIEPISLVLPNDARAIPRVIAHRGYSAVAPENTLAAMASGARAGADWVETDVAHSADQVPFILHDGTVDRTTNGRGALNALNAPALDLLDAGAWFSPAFRGQPLPRLDALIDEVRRGSADFLLEVKGPQTRAQVERIVAAVRAKGMIGRTLLQSFDVQVLKDARELAPDLQLGLLRGALDADPVATARELGVVTYNPSWDALKARPEVVGALNAAGVAVMPYTVDDAGQWAAMRDAGVDGIITNRPGALVGWNARYAQAGAPAPVEPVRAELLAPLDGARLERGDALSLALAVSGARDGDVTVRVDGAAAAEGDTLRGDALARGRHVVTVSAIGADGSVANDTATFRVKASPTGLAHLVAVSHGIRDGLRVQLLRDVLSQRWSRFVVRVERNRRDLPRPVAEQLTGDAHELGARD